MILGDEEGLLGDVVAEGEACLDEEEWGGEAGEFTGDGDSTVTTGAAGADERAAMTDFINSIAAGSVEVFDFVGVFASSFETGMLGAFSFCLF